MASNSTGSNKLPLLPANGTQVGKKPVRPQRKPPRPAPQPPKPTKPTPQPRVSFIGLSN